MEGFGDYPLKNFIIVDKQPITSILYKTHRVPNHDNIIKVKNRNVSNGLMTFFDLRLATKTGVHIGYYIETPYCFISTHNYISIYRRRKIKVRIIEPKLVFTLPCMQIYSLNSNCLLLASAILGSSLVDIMRI